MSLPGAKLAGLAHGPDSGQRPPSEFVASPLPRPFPASCISVLLLPPPRPARVSAGACMCAIMWLPSCGKWLPSWPVRALENRLANGLHVPASPEQGARDVRPAASKGQICPAAGTAGTRTLAWQAAGGGGSRGHQQQQEHQGRRSCQHRLAMGISTRRHLGTCSEWRDRERAITTLGRGCPSAGACGCAASGRARRGLQRATSATNAALALDSGGSKVGEPGRRAGGRAGEAGRAKMSPKGIKHQERAHGRTHALALARTLVVPRSWRA
jgi:hypothetical protein